MPTAPRRRTSVLVREHGTLLDAIDRFASQRVLVIGDLIADEFIYGEVARISREAPVLILEYETAQIVAGGAGNAANNVAALGGRALLAGLVGADAAGRRLLSAFGPRVDRSGVVRAREYGTPIKTRVLAGGLHSAKQQVVRIDRAAGWPLDARIGEAFGSRLTPLLARADAVVLSDYGSGLVTPALARRIRSLLARQPRRRAIPILLDTRYRLLDYSGLTICTPNESEVERALGIRIDDDLQMLERAGRTLLRRTRMAAVLVTRGSRGMALFQPKQPPLHLPIVGSDEVTDVTGAGDTVIATVALALAAGATFRDAARIANHAGGIVVMKQGTATVSMRELRDAVSDRAASKPDRSNEPGRPGRLNRPNRADR